MVQSQGEKPGGRLVQPSFSFGLSHLSNALGLVDLGFSGGLFTWSYRRHDRQLIRECLDRGLANPNWRLLFSRAVICHFPRAASDHHSALFLDTFGAERSSGGGGAKPFRFEAFRTRDGRSTEVVKEA